MKQGMFVAAMVTGFVIAITGILIGLWLCTHGYFNK